MSYATVRRVRKETTLKAPIRRRKSRGQAASRGQAMVEYSVINFVLIMMLCLVSTARVFPGTATGTLRRNVIELFLDAYQVYYDSYYFVLNLPFP